MKWKLALAAALLPLAAAAQGLVSGGIPDPVHP